MIQNISGIAKRFVSRKLIITLILLVTIWIVGNRNAQNTKAITLATVEKKPIAQTISASGVIRSQSQADIKFATGGRLAYISIQQGDHVKKYQTIASLDTQDFQKRLKQDLNLYLNQRLTFEDTKDSQKDQVISDSLKRIAQRAQDTLDNTVIDVEIRDLAIKFSSIYSPIDGDVVNNPKFFAGSNVTIADTIATVADLTSLEFVSQVDETEIGKVAVGQESTIALDAFPDEKIEATVERIAPVSVTTSTGSTAFEVVFALPKANKFKIGMNGTAEVQTQKAETTLVIPLEAIQDENTVYAHFGRDYQKKTIEKGIESDTEVAITKGLNENEQIVTSGFDQLTKGSLIQKILKKL